MMKAISIPERINQIEITGGTAPKKDNECLVDMKLLDEPVGPFDLFDTEYDDWKDEVSDIRDRIRELLESIEEIRRQK